MKGIIKGLFSFASFFLLLLALMELEKVKKKVGLIEEDMDSWYYGDY